jgi:hypothetical protein
MKPELLQEIKAHRAREDRKEHVADLVDQLARALNIMGREEEVAGDFLEAITGQHRTLQQNLMGVVFKTVHGYKDARHDLRNEGAVNACKRIDELLEGEEIHLPFI